MKLTRTRLGVALATAAIAITGSVTAVASPAHAAEDVAEGGHCVATMPETVMKCFATYEESQAYVSSIAEILPDKRSGVDTVGFDVEATKVSPQAGWRLIFIGFDWEFWFPFAGSLSVVSRFAPCTGPVTDWDDWVYSLPRRWNDDISSYLDFSNCWTKLYEHINFGGASRGFTGDSPTLPGFNNRASSIVWS